MKPVKVNRSYIIFHMVLRPSEVWLHKHWSTLWQVMACYLMLPSQSWLTVNWTIMKKKKNQWKFYNNKKILLNFFFLSPYGVKRPRIVNIILSAVDEQIPCGYVYDKNVLFKQIILWQIPPFIIIYHPGCFNIYNSPWCHSNEFSTYFHFGL